MTREELYLAALAGEPVSVPRPITNVEKYLCKILQNGGLGGSGGSGSTDEALLQQIAQQAAADAIAEYMSTYQIPVASAEQVGGVMPAVKSEDMTQQVGVDELGGLWTVPGSGGSAGGSAGWTEVSQDDMIIEPNEMYTYCTVPVSFDSVSEIAIYMILKDNMSLYGRDAICEANSDASRVNLAYIKGSTTYIKTVVKLNVMSDILIVTQVQNPDYTYAGVSTAYGGLAYVGKEALDSFKSIQMPFKTENYEQPPRVFIR